MMGNTITNPYDTASTFNSYFAATAKLPRENIECLHNIFQIILWMKVLVQYCCNLQIKKK